MSVSPKTPVRADHRFIKQVMGVVLSGKVEQVPQEFNLVSAIFKGLGGSWESIFKGSPKDIDLLKKVIAWAYKNGRLTKRYRWNGSGKDKSETGKDCS